MSIRDARGPLALDLLMSGWSNDTVSVVVLAVHPLDDRPVPGRAYEREARSLANSYAKELALWRRSGNEVAAKGRAIEVLGRLRTLAEAHGESPHFVHRFDEFLGHAASNEAAPPAVERPDAFGAGQPRSARAQGSPTGASSAPPYVDERLDSGATADVATTIEEIQRLAQLREAGHLTAAEFEQLKSAVLAPRHAPSRQELVARPGGPEPPEPTPRSPQSEQVMPSQVVVTAPSGQQYVMDRRIAEMVGEGSRDVYRGISLSSGVGVFSILGWLLTLAAVFGGVVAYSAYRSSFDRWIDSSRRTGFRLDELLLAEETFESWLLAARGVAFVALICTIVWLYKVAKETPAAPSAGSMIWMWFIPLANLVIVPMRLGKLSEAVSARSAGKSLREAAAWAASAGIIVQLIAGMVTVSLDPSNLRRPSDSDFTAYVDSQLWLVLASAVTPLALATFAWSLRRAGR